MNVIAVKASVHLPFNHQLLVQNLSTQVTRRLLTLACHVGAFLMSKSATNFAKSIKSYILCPITYKNCLYLAFAFVCFIKDVALLCFALWKIVIGSTHSMNIVVGFLVYDATLE